MGVLYARVGGAWVPIASSAGVDIPTGDARWVNVPGDTMTGQLLLPNDGLSFVPAGANSLGRKITWYTGWDEGIQSSYHYERASSTGGHIWYRGGSHSDTARDPGPGGVELMRLSAAGLDIASGLNIARPLGLYGMADASSCYIGLYDGAATPTRLGWIGYSGGGSLYLTNERAGSYANIQSPQGILFTTGSEAARINVNGYFLLGKTAQAASSTVGCELQPAGVAAATCSAAGIINAWFSKVGAANANGQKFVTFRNGATEGGALTEIGFISQATATTVNYSTTSDYRLKDVLGPVDEPVERVRRLRPVHFSWRSTGDRADGFLAHEVAEVVPDAVVGDKDATADDGSIEPQGLDASKLVPLLTAALQTALDRIDQLEARITALEAA